MVRGGRPAFLHFRKVSRGRGEHIACFCKSGLFVLSPSRSNSPGTLPWAREVPAAGPEDGVPLAGAGPFPPPSPFRQVRNRRPCPRRPGSGRACDLLRTRPPQKTGHGSSSPAGLPPVAFPGPPVPVSPLPTAVILFAEGHSCTRLPLPCFPANRWKQNSQSFVPVARSAYAAGSRSQTVHLPPGRESFCPGKVKRPRQDRCVLPGVCLARE
jgi:hypothetical protein